MNPASSRVRCRLAPAAAAVLCLVGWRGVGSADGGAADAGAQGDAPGDSEGDGAAVAMDGGMGVLAPANEATPSSAVQVTEVVITGRNAARELRRSAQAVEVVEVKEARRESATLGTVLSRSKGVNVQQAGGLGSVSALSVKGLSGRQVRVLVDGVPFELTGLGFDLAAVPVSLVERVDIYKGVVPVQLGTDALGGAVNVVTARPHRPIRADAAYEVGSFGTHRVSGGASVFRRESGLHAELRGFLDRSRNDYFVDVLAPDVNQTRVPVRVRRFHDAYQGRGLVAGLGVARRSWADELTLRGFWSAFDKDLQHDITFTGAPFGDARYGNDQRGTTLRYVLTKALGGGLDVDALGGVTWRTFTFRDVSTRVYDWWGRVVAQRARGGELGDATDQTSSESTGFLRASVALRLGEAHTVRASSLLSAARRTGKDHLNDDPAFVSAIEEQGSSHAETSGLAWELRALERRIENVLFVKHYRLGVTGQDRLMAMRRGVVRPSHDRLGAGNALRFAILPWLWVKASAERATRLPDTSEIFGDGVLVAPNVKLGPETSDNLNLSLRSEVLGAAGGGAPLSAGRRSTSRTGRTGPSRC